MLKILHKKIQAVVNVGLDASKSHISETLGDGALIGYRLDENGNGVFNPGLNYAEEQHITNTTLDFYLKYSKSYENKIIKSFDVQAGYAYQNFKTDGNKDIYAYAATTEEGVIGERYK